ncbi:Hypothetical predicted protein [Octopus vulgaris]|uniref:Uncharacterized protein n=1 Tax=Octopus vulgaris TaxID=6645 RepID=A0AA36F3L8_OCTVU|nr:Hypothetical predicted protein [Octopus vulgaris]
MKEVRYEIRHNNANWKDREIDPDDIASVLFQDVRLLCKAVKKSFTNILSWEGEPPPEEDSFGYQPWIGYVILSCGIVVLAAMFAMIIQFAGTMKVNEILLLLIVVDVFVLVFRIHTITTAITYMAIIHMANINGINIVFEIRQRTLLESGLVS